MTEKRGYEFKTQLTPREKLKVAYFHDVRGVAQHVLADMFEVNSGRIAEAIAKVREATGWKWAQRMTTSYARYRRSGSDQGGIPCAVCGRTDGYFSRATYEGAPDGGVPVHMICLPDFYRDIKHYFFCMKVLR